MDDGDRRGVEGELVLPGRQRRRRGRNQPRLDWLCNYGLRSHGFCNRGLGDHGLCNRGLRRSALDRYLLGFSIDLIIRVEKEIGISITRIIVAVHQLDVVRLYIVLIVRTDHVMGRNDTRLIRILYL